MELQPAQVPPTMARDLLTNPYRGKKPGRHFTGSSFEPYDREFLARSGRGRFSADDPIGIGLSQVVETLLGSAIAEERNRLAREIHDTLVQEFAGILLHLEAANSFDKSEKENLTDCLASARELAKCGLEDARRMLLGLRPKPLDGACLPDALEQLAERFSRDCGINCAFGASGRAHKIPEEIEDELYRVAQEALCNVRKHSCAHSVAISLTYRSVEVTLTVQDNGQGFTMKRRQAGAHGFGLSTMRDRALRLGGRMDINTTPGKGAELSVTVPFLDRRSVERNYQ